MATLVNFLKIGADGLEAESDPTTDSLNLQNIQLTGVDIGSEGAEVDGPTVINDDSNNYTNFTPAGDTLRETLEAIDSAIGTINTDNSMDKDTYTNDNASPITLGQAVYISSNDSVDLAENDDDAKDDPIGLVCDASIASSADGLITTDGLAPGVLTGATFGTKYFLDSTPGDLTTTPPAAGSGERVVFMGYAKNATDLVLRIEGIGKRA
jgi:hypothetical protein